MSDDRIVRARIHPAVGIARVGDSDEYFLGPEVVGQPSEPPGSYKDGAGRLRRQAARFRVYGYDARGAVVKELTLDDASITSTRAASSTSPCISASSAPMRSGG